MYISILEKIIFYFFCYSFFGWLGESIYKSIKFKKIINTGFLKGPLTPIFGLGALLMIFLEQYLKYSLPEWSRIVIYTTLATLLEYLTSFFFEKEFHKKLWDYSDKILNIHGRICLQFTIYWFILSFLVINVIHPVIYHITIHIFNKINIIDFILISIFLIDIFFSFKINKTFMKIIKLNFPDLIIKVQPVFSNIKIPIINNFKLTANKNNSKSVIINAPYCSIKELTNHNINQNSISILNIPQEYYEITKDIILHDKFNELKLYKHHDLSIYDHVKTISLLSFKLCKLLNLDFQSTARGALLHDFFFYDWRKSKPIINKKKKLHAFYHSRLALINAEKYFKLNDVEKDIILKHMWPLTIVPPKYIESYIVSFIDKVISTKEFLKEVFNILSDKLNKFL